MLIIKKDKPKKPPDKLNTKKNKKKFKMLRIVKIPTKQI